LRRQIAWGAGSRADTLPRA